MKYNIEIHYATIGYTRIMDFDNAIYVIYKKGFIKEEFIMAGHFSGYESELGKATQDENTIFRNHFLLLLYLNI